MFQQVIHPPNYGTSREWELNMLAYIFKLGNERKSDHVRIPTKNRKDDRVAACSLLGMHELVIGNTKAILYPVSAYR